MHLNNPLDVTELINIPNVNYQILHQEQSNLKLLEWQYYFFLKKCTFHSLSFYSLHKIVNLMASSVTNTLNRILL